MYNLFIFIAGIFNLVISFWGSNNYSRNFSFASRLNLYECNKSELEFKFSVRNNNLLLSFSI